MRFLYLPFIVLSLHLHATSEESGSISSNFDPTDCKGCPITNDICSRLVGEGEELKVNGDKVTLGGKDVTNQVREVDGKLMFKETQVGTYKKGNHHIDGDRTFKSGFSTPHILVSGDIDPVKASAECETQKEDANSCCSDPTTCLGGEHLATLNQINNIATQVGPGMAMLLQGTGKDMSGMCEALQAMAGAGAGLSTAAFGKCKSSISACYSSCDKSIKRNCETYVQAKLDCQRLIASPRNKNSAEQAFNTTANDPARKIVRHDKVIKPACRALNAKATEIANNLGQMANSAISAELCKQQASASKTKEECVKANGRWDGYKCITPEGECEKREGVWDGKKCKSQQQVCTEKGSDWRWNNVECVNRMTECEEAQQKGVRVVWDPLANLGKGDCRESTQAEVNAGNGGGDLQNPYGGGIDLNTETPGNNNDGDRDPDNPDNNQVGGGGSSPAGISGGSGGPSGSSDLLSGLKSSGKSKAASPANTEAGKKGSSYRGGRAGMGGFGRGFRGRKSAGRTPSGRGQDKSGLSMGGGGFSGYGGGSGDGDDSYASLGLSKKKLKELEKKAGAKRKAASEGLGGAHQNIFERITKRFQSLCKNKLDCR